MPKTGTESEIQHAPLRCQKQEGSWFIKDDPLQAGVNFLSPNSDQNQISSYHTHAMRIKEVITKNETS